MAIELDNNAYIRQEYDRLAPRYDDQWQKYLQSTHNMVLQMLDLSDDDKILDASGGTGLLAERIIHSNGGESNITIADISKGMLKVAEQRLGQYANAQIIQNDVQNLMFDNGSFTKVLSVNSLHFYGNPKKAISEFYRVLGPKKHLIIIDWCRNPFYFKVFDVLMKTMSRSHVRTYTTGELEYLLTNAGFEVEKVTTWSCGLWALMGIKAKRGE